MYLWKSIFFFPLLLKFCAFPNWNSTTDLRVCRLLFFSPEEHFWTLQFAFLNLVSATIAPMRSWWTSGVDVKVWSIYSRFVCACGAWTGQQTRRRQDGAWQKHALPVLSPFNSNMTLIITHCHTRGPTLAYQSDFWNTTPATQPTTLASITTSTL